MWGRVEHVNFIVVVGGFGLRIQPKSVLKFKPVRDYCDRELVNRSKLHLRRRRSKTFITDSGQGTLSRDPCPQDTRVGRR